MRIVARALALTYAHTHTHKTHCGTNTLSGRGTAGYTHRHTSGTIYSLYGNHTLAERGIDEQLCLIRIELADSHNKLQHALTHTLTRTHRRNTHACTVHRRTFHYSQHRRSRAPVCGGRQGARTHTQFTWDCVWGARRALTLTHTHTCARGARNTQNRKCRCDRWRRRRCVLGSLAAVCVCVH